MPSSWWEAAKRGSLLSGSNPFNVAAVMWVEAGGWRAGRIGRSRYQGPCGFNRACNIPEEVMYTPELQIEWGSDSVRITTSDHAKGLVFYPALDSAAFVDLPTQGESRSDTLSLGLDRPGPADRLVGVVEIGPGERGPRKLFAIDSTRPPLNPGKDGASNPKQPTGG